MLVSMASSVTGGRAGAHLVVVALAVVVQEVVPLVRRLPR